jgi:peptide/nickel transport system ATP-binding protein
MPSASEDAEHLRAIKGAPPSLVHLPSGCSFHPRCAFQDLVGGACLSELPELRSVAPGRSIRCHLANPEKTLRDHDEKFPS